MIYIIFNEFLAKRNGHPPFACTAREFDKLKIRWKYDADCIFEIRNGKTIYHKNRWSETHQITSEEEVVLRLKAVLI